MARPIARRIRNGLALFALLVAAGLALAGCGGSDGTSSPQAGKDEAPAASPEGDPTLVDIASVRELRDRFNADVGEPRLVLLLSPT